MTKEDFLERLGNWSNHRFLLWPALEATKHLKLPILELGCGQGSSPYLTQYCKDEGLERMAYDFNREWADLCGGVYVENWDIIPWRRDYAVALVDESPGEQRKFSLQRLHHVQIVVAHDTEPAADYGYLMRDQLKKFRYMLDYESEGAWATIVSNFIDVREFKI